MIAFLIANMRSVFNNGDIRMMTSTAEIMDLGMNCLLEKLGTVETEHFISVILREKSDYTKWRQKYFDNVSSDDFQAAAVDYARNNPLVKLFRC